MTKVRYPKVAEKGAIFLPDLLPQVKKLAARGLSDPEIAAQFGIAPSMMDKWRAAYSDFAQALDYGRKMADTEVKIALHKRATGYDYKEDALTRSGSIKALKRHAPPDIGAIKYWLNNRVTEDWRESSRVEHTGGRAGDPPVKVESRDELIASILSMIPSKPDNEKRAK